MNKPAALGAMPVVSPIDHVDLTEKVYLVLRDSIFARVFPPGGKLDLDQLAAGFRVSRAPINNAIIRLAADGLVRIEPRRGTFIRELTSKDLAETYEVRRALEIRSAELGIDNVTAEEIAKMEAMLQQMADLRGGKDAEYLDYARLDVEFHLAFVGLARNSKMVQIYRDLHMDIINARLYYYGLPREWREVGPEHQAILAGYAARDLDAVKAAIIVANENGKRITVQRIEELGGVV